MPEPSPLPADRQLPRPRMLARQWTGVLAGPLVLLLGLHLLYAAVPWACREGTMAVLHLGALATLLAAGLVAWMAWREWQRAGAAWPGDEGAPVGTSHLLTTVGLLLSAFFTVVALAQWLPMFFFSPCHGS